MKAILFDLDGTLVDTDVRHFAIWQDILRELGIEIDREFYQTRISGRENQAIVRDVLARLPFEEGLKIAEAKEARFREDGVTLDRLPGLDRLLEWIEARSLVTAVVTNAPRSNAEFMLAALNLSNRFDTVVLAEDAAFGKPDPAPYQLALERLSLSPNEAIVFEDTPSGIRSAVAAGLTTVGMATTHDLQGLIDVGAAFAIADFSESRLWDWLAENFEAIAS
ncbi:HAD family hydrolase [Baaleninema simplex]|uniref:HAD family hydrolase n=1 Tax=Baaleninema simplex TaxID=2862350 RepID=UPI00034B7F10|nr:HAD-IA family hydrolase [Baaleninema simplex]